MTLFEELGVEYKEVDGILYPILSVDEAEYNLADIGNMVGCGLGIWKKMNLLSIVIWQEQDSLESRQKQ